MAALLRAVAPYDRRAVDPRLIQLVPMLVALVLRATVIEKATLFAVQGTGFSPVSRAAWGRRHDPLGRRDRLVRPRGRHGAVGRRLPGDPRRGCALQRLGNESHDAMLLPEFGARFSQQIEGAPVEEILDGWRAR